MSFYKAIWASNSSKIWDKTDFPDALANIPQEVLKRGILDNWIAYFADIINPTAHAVKNILNIVNPYSMARNGVLKNTGKSLINAPLLWAKAVKNAGLWIGSGVRHIYRHMVQNNITNVVNGSIWKIPYVWPQAAKVIWHTLNWVSGILWTVWAWYDWGARKIDNWFDHLIKPVLQNGQTLKTSRIRQGKVSDDGLKVYWEAANDDHYREAA